MDWSHKQGKQSREKKLRENDRKDQGCCSSLYCWDNTPKKLKLKWERHTMVRRIRGFGPWLTLRASLSWRANFQPRMFQRMHKIQSLTPRLAAGRWDRKKGSKWGDEGSWSPERQAKHHVGEVSSDRTIKWNLLLQWLRRYWILPSYPLFLWIRKHTLGQQQHEGSQWDFLSPGHCTIILTTAQFFWPLQKRGNWSNSKECFIL